MAFSGKGSLKVMMRSMFAVKKKMLQTKQMSQFWTIHGRVRLLNYGCIWKGGEQETNICVAQPRQYTENVREQLQLFGSSPKVMFASTLVINSSNHQMF